MEPNTTQTKFFASLLNLQKDIAEMESDSNGWLVRMIGALPHPPLGTFFVVYEIAKLRRPRHD